MSPADPGKRAGRSTSSSATPGHVIFVLNGLTMGGAEAQLATILEADRGRLTTTRAEILTLTPERNDLVVRRMEALGIPVTTIDRTARSFPSFFLALVRYFRERRPDIVHTFLAGSTATWGRLAARLAGVPYVLHSDLSLDPKRTRAQALLDPLAHRLTTRFLPNANAIAERLARQGAPRDRIRVVRNGVDLARFDPDRVRSNRPEWGIPDDAVVAGFLGMFRPVKRPELFLDAVLALAEDERPDYLAMAGDGPLMPLLQERVRAEPWLSERCRLVGVVGDTPAFLAGVDMLVLTSDTEGLPNAILEAMAMGVPCIATRVSDVPELVADAGEVVETGDVGGLAAAIRRMVRRSPRERKEMGRRGRDRARAEYGLASAADRFWQAHRDFGGGGGADGGDAAGGSSARARREAGLGHVDIALFLPALLGGGAERVMLDLAGAFAAEGAVVQLVLASREGAYLGDVPEGVDVVHLGARRVVTSLIPLVRHLRRDRPRALLSTLEHANVVALLAARVVPGVRVVLREANTASRDLAAGDLRSRILVLAMRAAYPRADVVVAPSRGVAREVRDHLGVPDDRLQVIANPTITPRVMAGAERRPDHPWFGPDQPPVILGVGRLSAQKDFATLMRAFARVRERVPSRLVILGEGELRRELEAQAASSGVGDDVELPGFVADPYPWMAAAEVFVLSSAWEGLPNVLIQALALGTKVVSTDCPSGPDEITDGGRWGRLVPVRDDEAMADAILGTLPAEPAPPPEEWRSRYRPETVTRRYLDALGFAYPATRRGDHG